MKSTNNDFSETLNAKMSAVHDHFRKCFFKSIQIEKIGRE